MGENTQNNPGGGRVLGKPSGKELREMEKDE